MFKNTLLIILIVLTVVGCNKKNTEPNPCAISDLSLYANPIDSSTMNGRIVMLINKYRGTKGLQPLAVCNKISEVSKAHCQQMHDSITTVSHNGIEARADKIYQTFPCCTIGENLAWGLRTADRVVEEWIKSPEHEKNMVGDYDFVGLQALPDANGQYYFSTLYIKIHNNFALNTLVH